MYLIAYVISNSTIILIQLKNLIIWATGKFLKDPSREFSADSSDWCGRLWSGITLPEQPSKAKALHWDTWYSLLITLPPPGWVSYTSAKQLNSLDHILEASSSDAGFLWDFTNQVVQKTNLALYKNNPLLKDILSINGDVKMAGYWMFFLSLIHKGKEDNKNIRTQIKEASVEYFRRSSINTRYQKKNDSNWKLTSCHMKKTRNGVSWIQCPDLSVSTGPVQLHSHSLWGSHTAYQIQASILS